MKFIEKIGKFMYGRYGADNLYKFLFKVYILIFILSIFIKSNIIGVIEILLVIIIFFRFFSKNIYKRSAENGVFLKLKRSITKPFKTSYKRHKDKSHVYKKCHKCHKVLKLPVPMTIGFKTVKCPKCGKRNKVFVLKKVKVEVITS